MEIKIFKDRLEIGTEAGKAAGDVIRKTIAKNGSANIILATGMSQFETLNQLVIEKDIDWSKVRMFHLDEYIGMPETEKASFRKYLKERFIAKVGKLLEVYLINGEGKNPQDECDRLEKAIKQYPIDLALVGIGENGHLAFNDPPANYDVENAYLVVDLDAQCRQQQMGEGWFASIHDVPKQAISMSIRQIMKSKAIICACPDERKAEAVKNCLTLPVSNLHPASILQNHADCTFFLDKASSALLNK